MPPRDAVATQLPRTLYIEVTNRCNSRCATCIRTFTQLEPARDLTLDEFRIILDQFPAVERLVLHGIGEPLLNPDLAGMIRHARQAQPESVILFNSNAISLDETRQMALIDAGLDEYRISCDAVTAGTYAAIRGVDAFDTVVENVSAFAGRLQGYARPRLSLWFTAMRENLRELPALVDLAARTGVPEVYVQRLVFFEQGLAEESQSLYRRLRDEEEALLAAATAKAETLGILFRASGLGTPQESLAGASDATQPWAGCHRPWTTTYITANGNVLPCCISPFSTRDYAGLIAGNVWETPFAEIWNGERYLARRAALGTDQPLHPCELCGGSWSL